MKTNLEKLREILCNVEEVEKDLKELRFGCRIKMYDSTKYGVDYDYGRYICVDQHFLYQDNPEWSLFEPEKGQDYEIIGNEIQEHHLRMYCENKGYNFAIGSNGKLIGNRNKKGSYTEIQLDNKLSFENQPEETLGAIVKFLEDNK